MLGCISHIPVGYTLGQDIFLWSGILKGGNGQKESLK